ncbi:MAG: hypothetical protein MHPSP_002689, partial [Paramarteilia canceri]
MEVLEESDLSLIKVLSRKDFDYDLLIEKPEEFPAKLPFSELAAVMTKLSFIYLQKIQNFVKDYDLIKESSEKVNIVIMSLIIYFDEHFPSFFEQKNVSNQSLTALMRIINDTCFFAASLPRIIESFQSNKENLRVNEQAAHNFMNSTFAGLGSIFSQKTANEISTIFSQ